MNTGSGNSLIDVALSGIVVAAEQVGKVKAMLALAPRLEAADALRDAGWAAWTMLPIGQPERERLHRALAAYDAAKKGEANG